ncbi:hypothetical protein B0H19DRAFT_1055787 [Mycena capillaripes]|nr:hypothetical protein B0H19DRAFT_1055787 [Mycena capillaripes]
MFFSAERQLGNVLEKRCSMHLSAVKIVTGNQGIKCGIPTITRIATTAVPTIATIAATTVPATEIAARAIAARTMTAVTIAVVCAHGAAVAVAATGVAAVAGARVPSARFEVTSTTGISTSPPSPAPAAVVLPVAMKIGRAPVAGAQLGVATIPGAGICTIPPSPDPAVVLILEVIPTGGGGPTSMMSIGGPGCNLGRLQSSTVRNAHLMGRWWFNRNRMPTRRGEQRLLGHEEKYRLKLGAGQLGPKAVHVTVHVVGEINN